MRPQSAKAKGRRLQQWVRDKLIEMLMFTQKILNPVAWVLVEKI